MPLCTTSKTDNSDLRKCLNHQLSVEFAKSLIKFSENLTNSLKRNSHEWASKADGWKTKKILQEIKKGKQDKIIVTLRQLNCHCYWCILSTALKSMSYLIVLV